MTDSPIAGLSRLATWIRYGPQGDENIVAHGIAFLVWWRQLAMMSLLTIGLVASLYGASMVGEGIAPFAFLLGVFFGEWMLKLAPKYNVTKNY